MTVCCSPRWSGNPKVYCFPNRWHISITYQHQGGTATATDTLQYTSFNDVGGDPSFIWPHEGILWRSTSEQEFDDEPPYKQSQFRLLFTPAGSPISLLDGWDWLILYWEVGLGEPLPPEELHFLRPIRHNDGDTFDILRINPIGQNTFAELDPDEPGSATIWPVFV